MNDDHSRFEELILRLPDGGLTGAETAALQDHLNTCPDCRRLFRALRAVTEELDAEALPPAGFTAGVMAAIQSLPPADGDSGFYFTPPRTVPEAPADFSVVPPAGAEAIAETETGMTEGKPRAPEIPPGETIRFTGTGSLRQVPTDGPASPPREITAGAEPPRAGSAAASAQDQFPLPDRRTLDRRRRRRRSLAVFGTLAAVVVLLVGGGIFAARSLFFRMGKSAAVAPSIVMEAPAAAAEQAADTGNNTDGTNAAAGQDTALPAAEEAAPEEQESWEEVSETEVDQAPAEAEEMPVFTVPAGQEAAFEALLTDSGRPDGQPLSPLRTLARVEYRGVIYEFLTDDPDGASLLWRDAAESVDPVRSAGTPGDLLDLLGQQ